MQKIVWPIDKFSDVQALILAIIQTVFVFFEREEELFHSNRPLYIVYRGLEVFVSTFLAPKSFFIG